MSETIHVGAVTPRGGTRFTAGADLTAKQGHAVKLSAGKVVVAAAATDDCIGVLLTGGLTDTEVVVALWENTAGTVLVRAAGALATAGVRISFDSAGKWVASATAATRSNGRLVGTASGDGALVEAAISPGSYIALA